jgi:hypothetical protein
MKITSKNIIIINFVGILLLASMFMLFVHSDLCVFDESEENHNHHDCYNLLSSIIQINKNYFHIGDIVFEIKTINEDIPVINAIFKSVRLLVNFYYRSTSLLLFLTILII